MSHITIKRGNWDSSDPCRAKLEKALGGDHHLGPRLRVNLQGRESKYDLPCSWREACKFWIFVETALLVYNLQGKLFRSTSAKEIWRKWIDRVADWATEAENALPRNPDQYLQPATVFQGLAAMVQQQARQKWEPWDKEASHE